MKKIKKSVLLWAVLFVVAGLLPLFPADSEAIPPNQFGIRSRHPYAVERIEQDGKIIERIIVPGPPTPPPGFVRPEVAQLPVPNPAAGVNVISNVPASTWAFGCSATSAAMMFGHYDNAGYSNMYAGPTNGGVYPMTNATWGSVWINGENRALNPLSATRNGLDGRSILGHVDDYWIKYGNNSSDPFITGGWTQHTLGDCTGDYMATNQSTWSNSDGSTTFYNYSDGSPLYDYTGAEPTRRDGCHGMKLFVESRGYSVPTNGNFNQYIYGYDGNTLGFTFADFKAEIDAGRPVIIQVEGHSMLGFGYNDTGTLIYIHDTWDHSDHTMTWGGSYSGLAHYGVTVCRLVPLVSDSITVTSPNGGESWAPGSSHEITWTSTGSISDVDILYSYNDGASWPSVASYTENDGSFTWTVPDTPSTHCFVRVQDNDGDPSDASDAAFTITASGAETVSTPNTPSGSSSGGIGVSLDFTTSGSTSSLGHDIQYLFDWDDGTDSGWLAVGTTQASHSWAAAGTYNIRAMARCATHTTIESAWSGTRAVTISDGTTSTYYNSPAQYKVLPEVIWAPASGGGTWMSEVQVTDISGGSVVSVYYNTATGRRGPFVLWSNTGGALRSAKFANLLQTIDGLDAEAFTYYGTVGAVEFITQDGSHAIQAAARTLNGNYSKTFTALSLHDANTVDASRSMVIANLTNNASYRSTCGFFNPTADAVTLELRLRNSTNGQVGSTITRTLAGHEFTAFSPFTEAGVPYPGTASDNVALMVEATTGTGSAMCFGASANNKSNDPAAHVAVQNSGGYDNGPGSLQVLPEAIWAPASGGGTWMSEAQIVDMTGGSQVSAYFDYGGGLRRGPIALWTGGAAGSKVKYANLLQSIGAIDAGLDYYGRVGTVEFVTQDGSHEVLVTARTLNGNYSKTFPGLRVEEAETAEVGRAMLIQNYSNNATYRSTCGFYNPTAESVTVEFTLLNSSGATIGGAFSKTFAGYDFQAFSPFNEAGAPYPGTSSDNVILRVQPTSGTGAVMCFGASANNKSNDPASHLAVQAE